MPFPTDPALVRLTVMSTLDPCVVAKADLLDLLRRLKLEQTPIWQGVETARGDYLTLRSAVVKEMLVMAE